jgi:hypothetical protein
LSGQFGAASQGAWNGQLIVEVLEKALSLSRIGDAERILRRAAAHVDERILQHEAVELKQLERIALGAAQVALASADATWGLWVAQVYRLAQAIPSSAVVEQLAQLAGRYSEMAEAIDQLALQCRGARSLSADDRDALARLEQLRASLAVGGRRSDRPNPHLS